MRLFAFMIFLTVGSVHADPVIAPVKLEVFKSKTCGINSNDAVGINRPTPLKCQSLSSHRYITEFLNSPIGFPKPFLRDPDQSLIRWVIPVSAQKLSLAQRNWRLLINRQGENFKYNLTPVSESSKHLPHFFQTQLDA